ncbi:Aste57867_15649 [Aphanomyces stellatus]|uniref:Aste57867_15649 protein n=1 Tax=Aphanomyces stellatus TaxID=120398 RepID=A0A485L4X7_9STRA|nr:hypothetical protein As57867_015593 [Aphanomyces stellatus]VFT92445.1 Aste57867_15649 [Aphanomyces stellatus]
MEGAESIFAAARSNDLTTVQHLLDDMTSSGVDVNRLVDEATHNTLMHIACSNGNLNACKYLFMNGMYLNEPNKRGHTPLYYAADCGNLSLVKWMVSNGADIDTDYSRKASSSTASADGDRRYDQAFTPLQVACVKGHVDIVDFLVECNADLGGCSLHGVTALHFACHQGQKAIAKVLLEAGADMHAADSVGVSAMDLASGGTQSFLTAYDQHGTYDDEGDETNDVESPPAGNDDSDATAAADGPDVCRLVPDSIGKAFGASVARALASAEWKSRHQAVGEVTLCMQQTNSAKHFDAACAVLVVAARDSVAQVFSASMPLLKAAFNAVLPTPAFHTAAFHATHGAIAEILDLLLVRAAGAHEREASEAVTSLLFLACKSVHATQRMVATIHEHMDRAPTAWRQQLVYIRLLTAIASQYRFAPESGLAFEDAMRVSANSLDHSSVKVRSASVDLLVQSILLTSEASGTTTQPSPSSGCDDPTTRLGLTGSADEISDHVLAFADSLVHTHMGTLKPTLVANIHKGLKTALGNSKRLGDTRATPSKSDHQHQTAKLKVPEKKDDVSDADLPYAEPVHEQFKAQAERVTACFGDKVARCLFSNAWAPRVEGLSYLQKRLDAKQLRLTDDVLAAMDAVLQLALSDRVNAVYEGAIALAMDFVLAYGAAAHASAKQLQECLRPLVPRLVFKLGDSKARLQVVSEDALLFLSRQPLVGPVFVLDAMPALNAPSAILLANKLNLIVKLVLEFGVHDGGGALSLKQVLLQAVPACENKDAAVRAAAINIFSEAFKTARQATMPFLNTLARGARQKLISKLVELGVLESDLLMDEVDDFDVEATRPPTAGPRPPTASGSSTKHRPTLTSVSVLAPSNTSSNASNARSSLLVLPRAHWRRLASELPYGTALTDDQRTEHSRLLAVIGEPIVRCLLDKSWAPREAAVREMEKQVLASIKAGGATSSSSSSGPPSWPHDAATLVVLSQALELVLHDTVARVYQCALRLLQVVATDFVPGVAGHDLVLTSTLQPAIEAVLQKLGDSKPRVRADSYAVLHALASLPHVGARLVSRFLIDQLNRSDTALSPVATTEMLMLVTALLRESLKKAEALDLTAIVHTIVPALDNKHVDIRNAAVAAYTALYQVAQASGVDVDAGVATLKPAVREAITKNIVQLQKQQTTSMPPPSLSLHPSADDNNAPEIDSARGGGHYDMEKVQATFGSDVAALLLSSMATKRRHGLGLVQTQLSHAATSSTKTVWEVTCLLAKTLLVDSAVAVVLASFDLLTTVANAPDGHAAAIPWTDWGVHLVLGSTVRSVLQQAAHPAVRVRLAVKRLLQVFCHRHALGRTVVCTALLSVPDDKQLSQPVMSSARTKRLARLRTAWQLVARLDLLDELVQDPPPKDLLGVDNVVRFIVAAAAATHGSVQVRDWTKTVLCWFHAQDAGALARALQSHAPAPIQRQLHAMLSDGEGTAVATTSVVRTSRMSHVRRVAALRTDGRGDDHPNADDDDAIEDVVQTRQSTREKPVDASAAAAALPLWLRDKKSSDDDGVNAPTQVSVARGGAAGLVKARRKSRAGPSNNNADDDDDVRQSHPVF